MPADELPSVTCNLYKHTKQISTHELDAPHQLYKLAHIATPQ